MSAVLGRPSDYSKSLADYICGRMASGETITSICKEDDMPSLQTIWNWQQQHAEFLDAYACARKNQAHAWANQQVDLADTPLVGEKTTEESGPQGTTIKVVRGDNVDRSRLMVDARRWAAARSNPEAWGDRLAHQMLDEKGKPARMEITVTRVQVEQPGAAAGTPDAT